jgi:hypothetical protein
LPAVPCFEFALLPEILRPWALDICERVQCPSDFVGVTIMAALGSVIGRKVGIRPQAHTDWTEYPNGWALLIGRPGICRRRGDQGNRRRTLRLPAQSFIERFLLHVLPKGFKRIRHYGLLGPAGKAVHLAQARAALSVPAPDPVVVESVAAFICRIHRHAWARCGHCGEGCFVPTAPIPASKGHFLPPRGPP